MRAVEQTGSQAPCVMPRGVQQKRSWFAMGWLPMVAKRWAERAVNPEVAP